MLTIKDLGIRQFERDSQGAIVKSLKGTAPVAVGIPNAEFLQSKPFWNNSKIVSMNAHELMTDITNIMTEVHPSLGQWDETYVYRDKVDIHGYVEAYKQGSQYPLLTEEVPISDLAFSRVISRLPILGNDTYKYALAMKWEPTQVQIAIGLNVNICNNFNIMGNSIFLKTNRSFNYDSLRLELRDNIRNLEERFDLDMKTAASLMEIKTSTNNIRSILGDLMLRYDLEKPVIQYTDIHVLSQEVAKLEKAGTPVQDLWQLTNMGTNMLRFTNNGGENVLEHLQNYNQYLSSFIKNN